MREPSRRVARRVRPASSKILNFFIACLLIQQSTAVPLELSRPEAGTNKIHGGEEIKPGEFPFLVSINDFCGGSIIDDYHILTAAHCVYFFAWPNGDGNSIFLHLMKVKIGLFDRSAPGDGHLVQIDKIMIHPSYSNQSKDSDIAILKTNTSMMGLHPQQGRGAVSPISFRSGPASVGENLTVAGWGIIDYDMPDLLPVMKPLPRKTTVPVVSFKECARKFGDVDFVGKICAGFPDGHQDSCKGDSGGPLFRSRPGGQFELIGIVSFGPYCYEHKGYGIYTDVSSYVDWILEMTATQSELRRL